MSLRVTGEIVKVFEAEADSGSSNGYDDLRFRIELIVDVVKPDNVRARIWRKEFYRLQPTFPQEKLQPKHEPCDELILIEETSILDAEAVAAKDWNTVLNQVIEKLKERFDV
jgi:hypothetical protein